MKACQTTVSPSISTTSTILQINTSSKSAIKIAEEEAKNKKKSAEFFSPQSFLDGIINNSIGVIGFIKEARKVDDAFEKRMEKEKLLAEKVAAEKLDKEKNNKKITK